MIKISKQEKEWRAQDDANTLARYEEIMNDASRKRAAIAAAKKEAASLSKRAAVLGKVGKSSK